MSEASCEDQGLQAGAAGKWRKRAAISRASGPESRTIPNPPRPSGVDSATIVSRKFIGPSGSGRFDSFRLLQPTPLDLDLPNPVLLDLPRHRHREFVHQADVLRDLEMRDLSAAVLANLIFGRRLARFQTDPRRHRLPEFRIRQSHHLDVA